MGASRKLQGEIDRVLKKVQEGVDIFDSIWNKVYDTENANQKEKFEADLKKEIKKLQRYRDQIKTWIQSSEIKDKKALMDARKQIEREMERFKVCEKETKTKAFSKEGLGQQPKTDPKEKAKSETRDWLNNVVGDLESQIDNFEAEMEGLTVKKGKSKPNRLTHLETSIVRHKAHIMKLELILRLLDNDELSPEQVNEVKDFLEDYVERNQEDFDEFDDPDELYTAIPLEKVESLEELVAIGASGLVKGVGSVSNSAVLGLKGSIASSPSQLPAVAASAVQQGASSQDQAEETASQDSSSDIVPRTPPSKIAAVGSLVSTASLSISSSAQTGPNSATAVGSVSARNLAGGSTAAAILSIPSTIQGIVENPAAASAPSVANPSSSAKEEESISFLGRRSSPAPTEIGLGRGIIRSSMVSGLSSQASTSIPMPSSSISGVSGNAALGAAPAVSDMAKRNILVADERVGSAGLTQPLASPLSSRMVSQQIPRANDGSMDSSNVAEGPVIGRVFSPSGVSGVQWRPQTATAFQNQNETYRGRTEIAPDQREKFLQRFQQVQQQGHGNLLNVPHLPGGPKQFPSQQQTSLLQQLNSQTSNLSSPVGIGLGIQAPALATISSASQLPNSIHQQSSQHTFLSGGSKDADIGNVKADEQQQQQQQNLSDDFNAESTMSSGLKQNLASEDDLKSPYMSAGATSSAEVNQVPRDTDLLPGQPLQPTQSSASLGVIGRRSVPDLGAIVDNISVANPGVVHDHAYNLQMLEAAYFKLPQPKDSERVRNYIPQKPAVTPATYPQTQAPVLDSPTFWDRLGSENMTDILFFAFYYQQNTYQQYLAAKELKRQSWRYHRKYNTWFQRHEEPKVTNDDFEQGTYVYFDFHITDDNLQHGWCQRIKTEFTFEYTYLEDELV